MTPNLNTDPENIVKSFSADSDINALRKDISQLREVLDMIEWSINRDSNNVELWVKDLEPRLKDVLKHFR